MNFPAAAAKTEKTAWTILQDGARSSNITHQFVRLMTHWDY